MGSLNADDNAAKIINPSCVKVYEYSSPKRQVSSSAGMSLTSFLHGLVVGPALDLLVRCHHLVAPIWEYKTLEVILGNAFFSVDSEVRDAFWWWCLC